MSSRATSVADDRQPLTNPTFDGEHRGVRWFVEKGRADCTAPLVTLTSTDGVFHQVEIPDASSAQVHALMDAELERRAARKARGREAVAA